MRTITVILLTMLAIQAPSAAGADTSLGTVDFPISCDGVQDDFNRSMALIHHMMYVEAEAAFRGVEEENPSCAMAQWGIAMSLLHPLWPGEPSAEDLAVAGTALERAAELSAAGEVPEREQAYLDAAGAYYADHESRSHAERRATWAAAQQSIRERYPDDLEARILWALAHLAVADKTDRSFGNNREAGALLEELFTEYADHPGVIHYMIHAYDNPVLADKAVAAARAYDTIAPDVPHALHMPTHIFVRLGIWPDVISWNQRSAKAALLHPAGDAVSHHYPHALDYLMYGYLQTGDHDLAAGVLETMIETEGYQETFVSAYALASTPARYALERRQWEAAASLEARLPESFPWDRFPESEAISWFGRGLGAARSGDLETAAAALTRLEEMHGRVVASGQTYWATLVGSQVKTVAAWMALAEGNKEEAIDLMRRAADLEDSVDKHPVTPGAVLPARELLGEMLTEVGEQAEAIAAYEASLEISPNRYQSLRGVAEAAEQAGDTEKATEYSSRLAEIR